MSTNTVDPAQPTPSTVVVATDGSVTVTQVSNATTVTSPGVISTPFSPLDLSPTLWVDASDETTITESGGAVSQWDDKSGNGYHLTQATGTSQPTTGSRTINGLNALDFDGTNDFMTAGDVINVQTGGITILAVAQLDTTSGGDTIVSKDPTSPNTGAYQLLARAASSSKAAALFRESSTILAEQTINNTSTDAEIYAMRLQRDTTDGLELFRNGSVVASATTTGTTSYNNGTSFFVGKVSVLNYFEGSIAEIIVVKSALTPQQMSDTETYLANKWGITL